MTQWLRARLGLRGRWWLIQIRSISEDIGEFWCGISWYWMVLLLIYLWHLAVVGDIVKLLILSWMVAYFIVNTWPRRSLLDIVCVCGLLIAAANFVMAHQQ
jgi:hypothetical protein